MGGAGAGRCDRICDRSHERDCACADIKTSCLEHIFDRKVENEMYIILLFPI